MRGDFYKQLNSDLDTARAEGLFKEERIITSAQQADITVADGSHVINFCANNYLGLANHPELIAAAKNGMDTHGFGMASVRFICGTQDSHKQLEQKLANFLGMEDAILYSSCFDANGGLFETLLGAEDAIISDALNHASIIDGVRLCKAKRFRYANNDMVELEARLKEAREAGARHVLIATDGVFSMDGVIANLKGVCDLARFRGAWRIIDETYLDLADREPDGSEVRSALLADPDAIICNSFSKFFGMTGWRLGWAVVPEYTIEAVDDLATNYYLCAHTPTQHAALACFTPESLAVCEERRQELLARRRSVVSGLERIGLPLEVVPNGAFYAYFSVAGTGLDAWTFCERALEEAHVALTPGRDFGPATADTHVRLSYAASREALTEGLSRLGKFVASLR